MQKIIAPFSFLKIPILQLSGKRESPSKRLHTSPAGRVCPPPHRRNQFSFAFVFLLCLPCFAQAKKPLLLNGAGASFPYILYSKWFAEYGKANPSIKINYRSIGSGGGIRQFLMGTLDFGATDVPMKQEHIKKSQKDILHLPTTLGAVVLSYNLNLPQKTNLRLTAQVLADIYRGRIKKWNEEKLKKLNPNVALPNQNIVPIYRADGSGTTAVFTEYLSQFSPEWLKKTGKGKAIKWPMGLGGKGNEGVMGLIQKIPGSIGYIAMSYALNQNLPTAEIQNQSKHFVKASIQTVKTSAQQQLKKTKDLFQPLISVEGPNAYPMSSYTYLLVYKTMSDPKGSALLGFLNWFPHKGQTFAENLNYIALPQEVIEELKTQIRSIKITPLNTSLFLQKTQSVPRVSKTQLPTDQKT